MKLLPAFTFASGLLLAGLCIFSAPVLAQADEVEAEDSATSAAAAPDQDAEKTTPVVGASDDPLAGVKLREKYKHLPQVQLENGVYYQDLVKGTGKSPKDGSVIFIMIKVYNASGGEIVMALPDADESESAPSEEPKAGVTYGARWTYFGHGGGNFSFGIPRVEKLFFSTIGNMKEMGARLVYIPSELAYGEKGYTGQSMSIPPNMDLVVKVSLLRVRNVGTPQDLGFINPKLGEQETE